MDKKEPLISVVFRKKTNVMFRQPNTWLVLKHGNKPVPDFDSQWNCWTDQFARFYRTIDLDISRSLILPDNCDNWSVIGNAVDEYILSLNAILNENIYLKQTTPVFTCVLWLNYNGNFWDKAILCWGNQPIFPFMRKQGSPQILFQTVSLLALITLFSFLCEKQSWCHSEESANLFQDHLEFSEFCENPCEERRWIKSWITVQLPFNFLISVPAATPSNWTNIQYIQMKEQQFDRTSHIPRFDLHHQESPSKFSNCIVQL